MSMGMTSTRAQSIRSHRYLILLQSLGTDWDERVLPSIGNEIIKAVVAQYNAEQLLTQRDRVSRAVSCEEPVQPFFLVAAAQTSQQQSRGIWPPDRFETA